MTGIANISFPEVWRTLGGPEPRSRRSPRWWLGSTDLNVSVDFEKGVFYDHVQNRGGGVLALVETVLNCNRAGALAWLVQAGFLEGAKSCPEQRREYRRRRDAANSSARDIECWRRAYAIDLNARKLAATATGDDTALGDAASLCNLLENGSPEDIVKEFISRRHAEPEVTASFVAAGKEHDWHSRIVAAELVLLLARAQEREALRSAN